MYKKNVQSALNALRDMLVSLGANPCRIDLPRPAGVMKVGADDFIAASGKKAKKDFLALERVPLFLGDGMTGAALLEQKFQPPRWIVRDLIAEGLTILAGKPKAGKSWMVLGLVVAIASGKKALDWRETEASEVVYLALEDSEARLQGRLKKISASFDSCQAYFHCRWNAVEEGGLLALESWLAQHPNCRVVFIDTLAKVRRATKGSSSYYEDYEAASALKQIADKFHVGIVVVHHVRKQGSDDAFDLISGTNGISGSADTNLVLVRGRGGADGVLHVTGRDVTEQELALSFTDCVWKITGFAQEVQASKTQQEIVLALLEAGEPLGPTEIGRETERSPGGLSKTLRRMVRDKLIIKVGAGKYAPATAKEKRFVKKPTEGTG